MDKRVIQPNWPKNKEIVDNKQSPRDDKDKLYRPSGKRIESEKIHKYLDRDTNFFLKAEEHDGWGAVMPIVVFVFGKSEEELRPSRRESFKDWQEYWQESDKTEEAFWREFWRPEEANLRESWIPKEADKSPEDLRRLTDESPVDLKRLIDKSPVDQRKLTDKSQSERQPIKTGVKNFQGMK